MLHRAAVRENGTCEQNASLSSFRGAAAIFGFVVSTEGLHLVGGRGRARAGETRPAALPTSERRAVNGAAAAAAPWKVRNSG